MNGFLTVFDLFKVVLYRLLGFFLLPFAWLLPLPFSYFFVCFLALVLPFASSFVCPSASALHLASASALHLASASVLTSASTVRHFPFFTLYCVEKHSRLLCVWLLALSFFAFLGSTCYATLFH